MTENANPYTWAGVGLLVAGSLVAAASLLIFGLAWLTALGLAVIIIAMLLLALARSVPRLPPEFGRLLLETGLDNIAAIVEELGIREKAIYLPSSITGGRPQALLPLTASEGERHISRLPHRFIVRYGAAPDEVGLLVTTAGTLAVAMLEAAPGPDAADIEAAVRSLLVGALEVAGGVRVSSRGGRLSVEIDRLYMSQKPDGESQPLGSPLAAVAASVVAEARGKPVTIVSEQSRGRRYFIELQVSDEAI